MNSGWANETSAVFQKEVASELRAKSGLFTTVLFAFATVVAVGIAAGKGAPSPTMSAGLLWIALLFAAVVGATRTFLLEEEQGTADLLRLWANPSPVFWGKTAYGIILLLGLAAVLTPLHCAFAGTRVTSLSLLVAAIGCGVVGLAVTISVCGALAWRASGKGLLAGVLSLPLLMPILASGIAALRVAFGAQATGGWEAVLSLGGLSVALLAAGPYIFAAVWKA